MKEREIRKYSKAKNRAEKNKKKLEKQKEKREAKLKKKQDKLDAKKVKEQEINPFDVQDKEEEGALGGENKVDATELSEESSEEENSESSDSSESENESDDDGLHVPKTMHEIDLQKMEKQRIKNNKKRDKELKKIIKEKKTRKSTIGSNKDKPTGGFLRNSVLVQKTFNFFGRKSRPSLLKDHDDEDDEKLDDEHQQLDLSKRRSDQQPELNDYFVQTANSENKGNQQKEADAKVNKEVDPEFFKNGDLDRSFGDKENEDFGDNEENKKDEDDSQVFSYTQKQRPDGLPPLHKSKSKGVRKNSNVKKLVAPPKPNNESRKSVIEKVDLLDLLDTNS